MSGGLVVLWGLFVAGTGQPMSSTATVLCIALFVWAWKKTS